MGATICKYYQKFKTLIKKCFYCNTNIEKKISPPYKLKENEDEIIKSENINKIVPERKISDYVEENYIPNKNIKVKNQNSKVDLEKLKKDCSENSSENYELESDKKCIISSNKNLINECVNTVDDFTPKSPI